MRDLLHPGREDALRQEIGYLRDNLDAEREVQEATESRVRVLEQLVVDMRDRVLLERERREQVEAQAAAMREALEKAASALNAPTHEANDHNCQDWPPGAGCHGCAGDELREQAVKQIESILDGDGNG